jgi:Ca-activated chloride channel family protein
MRQTSAIILLAASVAIAACAKPGAPIAPQPPPGARPPAGITTPAPPDKTGTPPRAAQGTDKDRTDDWEYTREAMSDRAVGGVAGGVPGGVVGGVVGGLPGAPPPPPPPSPIGVVSRQAAIGFSAGGAKDVANFRENIRAGFLPLPTDVAYEGLFFDYSFDTGAAEACRHLFCPSYVAAISPDPFSGRNEVFLSVGLNSSLDASQFSRKRLNLVIVLDISGSMGSPFDEYYYDRFGNKQADAEPGEKGRTKLQMATRSIVKLMSHLADNDRLGIVLFDSTAYRAKRVRELGLSDRDRLAAHLLDLEPGASTNMEAGMQMAADLLEPFRDDDRGQYENRIIFLTDAMPNTGRTGEADLLDLARGSASHGVYATFIGIGVDFNTELVSGISKIRGANWYSVHSPREFGKRLDEEFEFMVTPLVFDLQLRLETRGYEIVKVYGSPEEDEAQVTPGGAGRDATTKDVMRVNTLFPSKVEAGQTRGGVILLRLRPRGGEARLTLTASYEDRFGRRESDTKTVSLPGPHALAYPTTGIRKAILLSRYADLLRNWVSDEGTSRLEKRPIVVSVTDADGIPCPQLPHLGRWERQSLPLSVSSAYRQVFTRFLGHFRAEASLLGDPSLDREAKLMEFLLR